MDAFTKRFCRRIEQVLADFPDYQFDNAAGPFADRVVMYSWLGYGGSKSLDNALKSCWCKSDGKTPIPAGVSQQIKAAIIQAVNAPHAV